MNEESEAAALSPYTSAEDARPGDRPTVAEFFDYALCDGPVELARLRDMARHAGVRWAAVAEQRDAAGVVRTVLRDDDDDEPREIWHHGDSPICQPDQLPARYATALREVRRYRRLYRVEITGLERAIRQVAYAQHDETALRNTLAIVRDQSEQCRAVVARLHEAARDALSAD